MLSCLKLHGSNEQLYHTMLHQYKSVRQHGIPLIIYYGSVIRRDSLEERRYFTDNRKDHPKWYRYLRCVMLLGNQILEKIYFINLQSELELLNKSSDIQNQHALN